MKVMLTNAEIESYLTTLADPKSFRNNINIKMPSAEASWAIRVNLKTLADRHAIYDEARKELGQEFLNNGKVEDDGEHVKKEYMNEYVQHIAEIATLKNNLELTAISKKDLDTLLAYGLSMPEEDFLMTMTDMTETEEEE